MPNALQFMGTGVPAATAGAIADSVGTGAGLSGTFVANGATQVTVANANLQAGDQIIFTLGTVGGTVGAYPSVKTRTYGTGFNVACTASDTSTYYYRILKA
jgi:hypothetical protein